MLLEILDDIIIEYSNTKEYIQQKLNEKCNREGLSIDKVIIFFASLEGKYFYKPSKSYIEVYICY